MGTTMAITASAAVGGEGQVMAMAMMMMTTVSTALRDSGKARRRRSTGASVGGRAGPGPRGARRLMLARRRIPTTLSVCSQDVRK